eukprot:PhF_6_TR18191/c0_g1_i1/m.26972
MSEINYVAFPLHQPPESVFIKLKVAADLGTRGIEEKQFVNPTTGNTHQILIASEINFSDVAEWRHAMIKLHKNANIAKSPPTPRATATQVEKQKLVDENERLMAEIEDLKTQLRKTELFRSSVLTQLGVLTNQVEELLAGKQP